MVGPGLGGPFCSRLPVAGTKFICAVGTASGEVRAEERISSKSSTTRSRSATYRARICCTDVERVEPGRDDGRTIGTTPCRSTSPAGAGLVNRSSLSDPAPPDTASWPCTSNTIRRRWPVVAPPIESMNTSPRHARNRSPEARRRRRAGVVVPMRGCARTARARRAGASAAIVLGLFVRRLKAPRVILIGPPRPLTQSSVRPVERDWLRIRWDSRSPPP